MATLKSKRFVIRKSLLGSGSYTATNNIPKAIRDTEAVVELVPAEVEETEEIQEVEIEVDRPQKERYRVLT